MDVLTTIREIADASQKRTDIIGTIAQVKLGISLDSSNLHNLSSENIRVALESAFKAGAEVGLTIKR